MKSPFFCWNTHLLQSNFCAQRAVFAIPPEWKNGYVFRLTNR